MKKAIPILVTAATMWIAPVWANSPADPSQEILALERQVMDGWLKGNPDPLLAISDPQVSYLHDAIEKRVEGLPALKEIFERYRGRPLFDSYEILDPKVQAAGEVAVLTYQLAQHNGSVTNYWKGTEVYWKKQGGWRLIHSHWSAANPRKQ